MNRQIKILGLVMSVLFTALFVQVNYLQIFAADRLNSHPANNRAVIRDFSRARGIIQTADGTVIARSVDTEGELERRREYPEGPLFAHVTGYFSFNYGSDGIERTYNEALTGRDRSFSIESISDLLVSRQNTGDVTLTLSAALQRVAAEALGDRTGAVVALDPRTGAILAMVDHPTYDPNLLAAHDLRAVDAAWRDLNADPAKPLLPRTYRERYFPGSAFKIVTAATALASGQVTPTDPVYPSVTAIDLPNTDQTLQNFGGSSCGGTIAEALRRSCNTSFAQMGLDLGAEVMAAGAASFGFRQVPPIDLPFAVTSVFPEAAAFARDLPGLAKSAIGQQDVAATPLAMALVAAAIANRGTIMEPHLMLEIRDEEGTVIDRFEPRPWLQATTAPVAAAVSEMMLAAVQSGTGTAARISGVPVAGKTGTAQTGLNTSHTWFVAFAPADDPQVAVAVMLENRPNSENPTGGGLSAPIARTVIQAALGIG